MAIANNTLTLYFALIASKVNAYNVPLMYAVGGLFLAFSSICVLLRIYVRTRLLKCWGWDDWFIVLTWGIFIGECYVLFAVAQVESVPKSIATLQRYSQLLWTEQILYVAGTITLKVSLAVFFLRFIVDRWARIVVWASTIIYCSFALSALLLVIFECGVPGIVALQQLQDTCVSFDIIESYAYAQGVLNALSDWTCALLPMYFLAKSKMTRGTKLSACVILGLAVAGSIASCVRTYYIRGFTPSADVFNTSLEPMLWTVIEPGLGITAACLACLRPLLKAVASGTKSAFNSTLKRSNKEEGQTNSYSTPPSNGSNFISAQSMAYDDMFNPDNRMEVVDLEKGPIGVTTVVMGGSTL